MFSMNTFAQSGNLLAANLTDNSLYLGDMSVTDHSADVTDVNTTRFYEIPVSAVHFEMDPTTNIIDIDITNKVQYTKAELLSKDTNQTIQNLELNESNNSVDVSNVESGTYYIILSNDEGKVFSEKIIIL